MNFIIRFDKFDFLRCALARLELVEAEHQKYAEQSKNLADSAEKLNDETSRKRETVKKFDETENAMSELKMTRDKLQSENQTAEFVRKQKENEKDAARVATEKIKLVEADYKIHISASVELKSLETERTTRSTFLHNPTLDFRRL